MLGHVSLEALTVIVKRNRQAFPSEAPLVNMSIDIARVIVENYRDRKGDASYVDMTPIEFQAHVMVREQDRLPAVLLRDNHE